MQKPGRDAREKRTVIYMIKARTFVVLAFVLYLFKTVNSALRRKGAMFALASLLVPLSVLLSVLNQKSKRVKGVLVFTFLLLILSVPLISSLSPIRLPLNPPVAQAATSNTLNFQGRLLTNTGGLVPDGEYNVEFNLYYVATGGTTQWTETRLSSGTGVTIRNGYFSVYLGDQTAIPALDWSEDLYLGMTIRGTTSCVWGSCSPTDSEMTPRFKLTAVPYAFKAANVASSNTNAASTNSDAVSITTGNALGATSNSGNLNVSTGSGTTNSGNITIDVGNGTSADGTISIGTTNTSGLSLGSAGSTFVLNSTAVDISSGGVISGATGFTSSGTITLSSLNCTTFANGGALTTNGSGVISCSDDDGGGGGSLFTDAGAATYLTATADTLLVGASTANGGKLEVVSTTEQLRLSYDASNNTTFTVSSGGDLTVTPSGGQLSLAGDLEVTAGNYLSLAGGNTASRPGTPTEGMVYFDTTTDSLLTYANGKWQSDRGEYVVVAANDSTQAEKDSADYVADGTADQTEINYALTEAAGGKVILLAGTYVADETILIPNNTTLAGTGPGTLIQLDVGAGTDNLIEATGTNRTGQVIRDLGIDGSLGTGGTQKGIYLDSVGNVNARLGGTIQNIRASSFTHSGSGVELNATDNTTITDSNFELNDDGIKLTDSNYSSIIGNTFISGGNAASVSIDSSTKVSVVGNSSYTYNNFYISNSTYITFDGNSVNAGVTGIEISGVTDSVISNNTFSGSSAEIVDLVTGSNNNLVTGNIINVISGAVGIRLFNADFNQLIGNRITGSGCTGACNSIDLNAGSDQTYLEGNRLSGDGTVLSSINDSGVNTIYAGQQTNSTTAAAVTDFRFRGSANSTTAFSVQNAAGASILTVDTTNAELEVGNTTTAGRLVISDGSSNTATILVASTAGDYTYTIPTTTANDTFCLLTLNNCAGTATTLQGAYTADVDGSDAEILLTAADGAIRVRDAASTIGNLFTVEANGGGDYFAVTSTGITLGINTTLAAGQSLTITGGNTASRPGSPTEGMVYFDTDTDRLMTYANGKWQTDNREAILVAANNSSQADKDAADYVADGNTGAANDGDQIQINSALTAGSGKKVVLLAGTYVADATILIPNNTTLAGVGPGTVIELANLDTTENLIENSDTTTGTNVTIKDLAIDGREDLNTAGTQFGIYMNNMGSINTRVGANISNVEVRNIRSEGITLESSDNNRISNSNIWDNELGVGTVDSFGNTIVNNTFTANASQDIYLYNSGNITVTGNTHRGYTSILLDGTDNSTITGNTVRDSVVGIKLQNYSYSNVVSSNTLSGTIYESIFLADSSENTVSSNTIVNGFGVNDNGGITITNDSNYNQIIGNTISDDSCNTTCYAINIDNAASDGNYLEANRYSDYDADSGDDATINDVGTGTIYAGQSTGTTTGTSVSNFLFRGTNSTTAFAVQNAAGNSIFTVDTTNAELEVGNTTTAGRLVISDGSSNTATILVAATAGDYTYTIPTTTANDTFCLLTLNNCTGTATTLQGGYDNDADGSDSIIALTTADDSLIFRNPASGGTDSGYIANFDQLNTGAVDSVRINNAGTGNLLSFYDNGTLVTSFADGGNLLANNAATGTTGTTEAVARTNVTTVTLTAAGAFANNDVIFINNAGQDYYTRITAGGGTTTLTVSPAVSYDISAAVTKYTIQNIGATATDYTTQSNRFFQGYFLGGVVTGAGSTTLSDGRLSSTGALNLNATGVNIQNTSNSTTAFRVQDVAGNSLLTANTTSSTLSVTNVLPTVAGALTPTDSVTSTITSSIAGSVTGSPARFTDVDIGDDGYARIVYRSDAPNNDVLFVQCLNEDCSSNNVTPIATSNNFGASGVSIDIGNDGYARLAYSDSTLLDLIYTRCTNDDCSSKVTQTVDSTGSTGANPSIKVGSDGYARIAYRYTTGYDLKYAVCNNDDCTSPTLTTVTTTETVTHTDHVLGSDGFGRIVFHDSSPTDLIYVQCTNDACSTFNKSTVDSAGLVGSYPSIELGLDGYGRIVYSSNPLTLKFAQCTNDACTANVTVVDATTNAAQGNGASVFVGSNGFARIAYYEGTSDDLKLATCTNAACTTKTTQTLDSTGDTGLYPTIALRSDDSGFIPYMDNTNSLLKFAFLDAGQGQSFSGIDVGANTNRFNNIYSLNTDTNKLLVKNNSTTSLQVQNNSNSSVLTVDTINNRVVIGSSASDGSAKLLVVDSYNNGTDPTGVNGASYYNSSLNKLRCYENSAWKDCVGTINPLTDNIANALDIQEGTNNYFNINTTNASENISFGNATTNPSYNFLGSGTLSVAGSVSIAAGQSLTVTGGNTASRPGSPTEGMVYFDSTTDSLLTYANGKWQSDRGEFVVVAANDSTQAEKDSADYVADGNTGAALDGDQVQINSALTAASGKKVVLLTGTYIADGTILIPDNTTLAGVGEGTIIELGDMDTTLNLIENSNTVNGDDITIRDMVLNGRKDLNTAGTQNGIYFNTHSFGLIEQVDAVNFRTTGIVLDDASNFNTIINSSASSNDADGIGAENNSNSNTITTNYLALNAADGIWVTGSSNNTFSNNTIVSNNGTGIKLDNMSVYSSVTGNTLNANNIGIRVVGDNNSITGNVVSSSTSNGIILDTADWNAVTSNNVTVSGGNGIQLEVGSDSNVVASNTVENSGGATLNNNIYIDSSDANSIIGNMLRDVACTTNCFAINIFNSTSDKNYIEANLFSGSATDAATINDAGTNTIYAGQQTNSSTSTASNVSDFRFRGSANSTTAFQVQNASGASILTVDSTNAELEVGNTTTAGRLVISDGSSNTATILVASTAGNYTYTIPTTTANDTFCLVTLANCGGGGSLFTDGGTFAYLTATTDELVIGGSASVSAKLAVIGDADEEQLLIRANATQSITNPLALFQDSSGAELFRLNAPDNGSIFLGLQAGSNDDGNNTNVGIGQQALLDNTNGYDNTAVGRWALRNNGAGGERNTAIGSLAMNNSEGGYDGVAVGFSALAVNTGSYNVAVGSYALDSNTSGYSNVAVGRNALGTSTSSENSIAIGDGALSAGAGGYRNIALGSSSLNNVQSSNNIAIGFEAGDNLTTGNGNNIIIGLAVDASSATADYELRIGNQANITLQADLQTMAAQFNGTLGITGLATFDGNLRISDGSSNYGTIAVQSTAGDYTYTIPTTTANDTFCLVTLANCGGGGSLFTDGGTFAYLTATTDELVIGGSASVSAKLAVIGDADEEQLVIRAFSSQTDDNPLVMFQDSGGTETARLTVDASGNQFWGLFAGGNTQAGATDNIGLGANALDALTSGDDNIAIGEGALSDNAAGSLNVAIGAGTLRNNTAGSNNVAIGAGSMFDSEGGSENVGIGTNALSVNTGNNNIALGLWSLMTNTSGGSSVAIGQSALRENASGSVNIAIGEAAMYNSEGGQYNIALGYQALASTTANGNIAIGYQAGDNLTSGANNIIIGYGLDASSATVSNELRIGGILQGSTSTLAAQFNGTLTVQGDTELNGSLDVASSINSPFGGFGIISNMIYSTEDFADSGAWTTTNLTVTADSTVAPNGTTTADTLTSTAAGGSIYGQTIYSTPTTMTYSVWVRSVSGTEPFSLRIDAPSGTPATGTAASFTATTTWQRYNVTQAVTGSPTTYQPTIIITNNTSSIVAWGAQMVVGDKPGAYFKSNTESYYNPTDVGLAVSGRLNVSDSIYLGNGDANNSLSLSGNELRGVGLTLGTSYDLDITLQAGSGGSLVFDGMTDDITTGTNQDLIVAANGTGTINLNDTITVTGLATLDGNLRISDGSSNYGTIAVQSTAGDYTYTIPTTTANDTFCLVTLNNCSGSASTLQGSYTADADGSDAEILLTAADGAIRVRDAASTVGNLFVVEANGGSDYFAVSSTGITLGINTTLAASQSLTITGGNTASRPGTPTEGMVYFDSTTDSLITYANGKWQSDRGEFVVVAANDSTQAEKDSADYVADGNTGAANDGDQIQINLALTEAAGGKVILLAGTYVADATILVPNNTTLAGVGNGTLIELADLDATDNLIENSDTTTGTGVVIRDLKLDGRDDLNTAGTQHGIYFNTASDSLIENIYVEDFRTYNIYLTDVSNRNRLTNVNSTGSGDNSIYILNSDFTAITNSFVGSSGNNGLTVEDGENNIVTGNTFGSQNTGAGARLENASYYNTISGNTFLGSAGNHAVVLDGGASSNSVTGNSIYDQTTTGIVLNFFADNNTITGNNIDTAGTYGIAMNFGSDNNLVQGNTINRSGGSTTNNGISTDQNDSNSIIDNVINDDNCSTNCYAITITSSTNTYLSGNRFSASSGTAIINDAGTGTIYSNQTTTEGGLNTLFKQANSTTAFQVQNASGASILTVDTTNAELEVGNTTTAGRLVISDGSSNTATILVASTAGDYTYTIPTTTANDTFCLVTLANCAGLSSSLVDNIANSWDIQEGSSNYLNIDTTNTTESISLGNATTNPDFNLLGSGTLVVASLNCTGYLNGGTLTANGSGVIDCSDDDGGPGGLISTLTDNTTNAWDIQEGTNNYFNVNTTNTTENISFGNATTNPSYNFLGSGAFTVEGSTLINDILTVTNTLTDTGQNFDLNVTLGNDAGIDTIAGLNLDVTSAATGDADILYGLNVGNLTSGDATTVKETGIRIGTGWSNGTAGDADLAFDDTTPVILLGATDNTGVLTVVDSSNNDLLQFKDLNTNFGAYAESGAFISRNSYFGDEFNKPSPAISADTVGNGVVATGFGDNDMWGSYEQATTECEFTVPADTINGITRLQANAAANECAFIVDETAVNNTRLMLDADNLPVMLFKVRPGQADATSYSYIGMADATDALASVAPTNFVGFTNDGGTTWTGKTISNEVGGGTSTVTCTGATVSTTQFALLKVEVVSASSVNFYVDEDVSNGIQWRSCGNASTENNIPDAALAPEIHWQERTGGTGGATSILEIDFYRVWQDDSPVAGTNLVANNRTPSNFGLIEETALAQQNSNSQNQVMGATAEFETTTNSVSTTQLTAANGLAQTDSKLILMFGIMFAVTIVFIARDVTSRRRAKRELEVLVAHIKQYGNTNLTE